MARKNISQVDASEVESANLDYVLRRESLAQRDGPSFLAVEDALREEAVYEYKSSRDITRVLFISQDESLLNPTQQSLDGYINLADLFDEVHILILRQGIEARNPVLRLAKNMWLYTASDKNWWWTPVKGNKLVSDQLVFADGFRPDIIVARDPFESAVLANYLGKKYERPVQIHVLEDYTKAEFLYKNRLNKNRSYLPRFTIKRALSVRTSTRNLYELMVQRFKIKDLSILPRFTNYESLIAVPPTIDLKAKYKPFVFIMLYIGKLGHESALARAIDAARFGLKNPHIGLIVLGNGLSRKEFEERAKILGIREQVVFETDVKDDVAYLKSANVLIVPDVTPESEEVALRGAAAGIPMVLARTPIREDIFKDGESAHLCDKDDIDAFSLKLNLLMNDVLHRKHMVEAAQEMIRSKFHEDPGAYKKAYRESIEQVLFLSVGDDEEEQEVEAEVLEETMDAEGSV